MLIAKGADVNAKDYDGMTPLHWVAWETHKGIAELLIAGGADVNALVAVPKYKRNYTPLDLAIEVNKKETAALIRKHGGKTGEELKAEGK